MPSIAFWPEPLNIFTPSSSVTERFFTMIEAHSQALSKTQWGSGRQNSWSQSAGEEAQQCQNTKKQQTGEQSCQQNPNSFSIHGIKMQRCCSPFKTATIITTYPSIQAAGLNYNANESCNYVHRSGWWGLGLLLMEKIFLHAYKTDSALFWKQQQRK